MHIKKVAANLDTEAILLAIGVIILIVHNCFYKIPIDMQMSILILLVFIIGVPHGALDFLVDEQNETVLNKKFSLKKFLLIYLGRLFAFALFWFLPWLAFTLFLFFSIFHFGETDMVAFVKPSKRASLFYLSYGSLIFSILLLSHLEEINETLPSAIIFLKKIDAYTFLIKYEVHIFLSLLILFIISYYTQHKEDFVQKITVYKIIELIFLMSILKFLPLTLAFTFYFTLWHSILSVRNIFSYFKNNNSKEKLTIICSKSILFSLLALGSIIGLYFIMKQFVPDFNLLSSLLVILSVLTLPHLSVMHSMYKNYSK